MKCLKMKVRGLFVVLDDCLNSKSETRKLYDKWQLNEVQVPWKKWKEMSEDARSSFHWAKPRPQPLLNSSNVDQDQKRNKEQSPDIVNADKPNIEIKLQKRKFDETNHTNESIMKFRNYEI